MPDTTARPPADATPTDPALVLRPWNPADAAGPAALSGDEALRRSAYELTAVLPVRPPAWPGEGHLHVRHPAERAG
ncbi:hypothetical protein [Streptomyces hawaiiensis]|uniref:Uncharacterized protein n=1 Tax=Streptomyces hawaiiensis TaxID=67305 RepID=A0A6G5RIT0_9ACTN|nr:hypothetical protein [Streptomyces hawaiiensis]QCD58035.1 hypothetical protein CEB94_26710 [Streptomyces hawaiiensis]